MELLLICNCWSIVYSHTIRQCLYHKSNIKLVKQVLYKRGSRGGGDRGSGPPPPPWDLSEVGSCVEVWWVGEGVQRLFSTYLFTFFFWLASLASIYTKRITYIHTLYFQVQYSVWNGHPFSIFPLSKLLLWKESNFPSLAFMKGHFHIFFGPEFHDFTPFKTKKFWGRTPRPPPSST